MVAFGNFPTRWVFYSKGNVFSFNVSQEGRKKSLKGDKVLELGYGVSEVVVNPEKNLIITVSTKGTVFSYNVDYASQTDNVSIALT
jgi:hypothetical protein